MRKKRITQIALIGWLLTNLLTVGRAQDKALLYKVTGPGLAKPSYLYGTFHLVCPTDLQLTDTLKKAVGETQQVYLELDLDDPAMMGEMQKAVSLPAGKTLKTMLSPADYTVLDNYLQQKASMRMTQLETFKPVMLMSLMVRSMLPCDPVSYDLAFAQMAAQAKKEVLGLETLAAGIAALDKIPVEAQLKGLVEMARNPDVATKEFTELMTTYKAHDVAKLMRTMKSSKFSGGDYSQFEESLLGERNANWIPVIEKAAKQKPTFFAFGAGHLGSDKGVLQLLRNKGYTITPVQ